MLTPEMTLDELAALIEKKRSKYQRAKYFQRVFERMHEQKLEKEEAVLVRFGITGEAYAPNYQVRREIDDEFKLFWGTSHKPCDADFPNGWDETNLTVRSFKLAELNRFRHA